MKKGLILFFGFLFCISFVFAEENLTGLDIINRVKSSNSSTKGLMIKGKLILKNLKTGNSEERNILILRKTDKSGLNKALFRFISSSYAGTTFLSIETGKNKSVQYLYLSSIGSPRQVEASEKENNFVDTDLTNEDLGATTVEDYNYKRLTDKKLGNNDCFVIERTPKFKSKYSKAIIFVEKNSFIPVLVKYFDKNNRLVKTVKEKEITTLNDHIKYAKIVVVKDLNKKHETQLIIEKIEERMLPNAYFNKNRMNKEFDF